MSVQTTPAEVRSTLVANPRLGPRERQSFAHNGFVKIARLFTAEAVDGMRELAEEQIAQLEGGSRRSRSRGAYRLHQAPHVQAILHDPAFRRALTGLTECGLVPTETQVVELSAGNTGVPWHYGYISYGYVRARDMGYTLWIPLSPIDADTDGGGMAYVPEHIVSARHAFDMGSLLAPDINAGHDPVDLLSSFEQTQKAMEPIFEQYKREDSFAVGDAFLFTKYVWHRSSPWRGSGDLRRLGMAMRFVDAEARVDRQRWRAEFSFGGGIGTGQRREVIAKEDRFARFPDLVDGALVRTSEHCSMVI